MTPLTAEQYSELVVVLERIRAGSWLHYEWQHRRCSAWCFVYLTQWFHKIGPFETREVLLYAITHMVAELCEERCL